jgi:hypothetical protein
LAGEVDFTGVERRRLPVRRPKRQECPPPTATRQHIRITRCHWRAKVVREVPFEWPQENELQICTRPWPLRVRRHVPASATRHPGIGGFAEISGIQARTSSHVGDY